ncbi:MAG TPA: hypothetical protein ENK28_10305 [Aliiroseovarius sp.]|nr:hypothetical protein [Aliiroseovarius sp.]
MPGRIIIVLSLFLGLSACSSRLNPMNWFQNSRVETIQLIPDGGFPEDLDGRILVSQVTDFKVMRNPGGAILQVTGLPPTQGYWDGELVPENNEEPVDGILTYMFRISPPFEPTPAGTPYSRRVIVAHFVSDVKLQGVSQIRIVGENNSRIARR